LPFPNSAAFTTGTNVERPEGPTRFVHTSTSAPLD
jgi:hypothetical protein